MKLVTVRVYTTAGHPGEAQPCSRELGAIVTCLHKLKAAHQHFATISDHHGYIIGVATWFGGDWIVRVGVEA